MFLALTLTGRRTGAAVLTCALLGSLAACGSDDGTDETEQTSGASSMANLTVLAASSLTDVFTTAGAAYEKEHGS